MVAKQAQVDDAGDPVRHEQEDDGEDGVEAVLGHHLALEQCHTLYSELRVHLTRGFKKLHCSTGLFLVVLISSNSMTLMLQRKMSTMSMTILTMKHTPTLTLMLSCC